MNWRPSSKRMPTLAEWMNYLESAGVDLEGYVSNEEAKRMRNETINTTKKEVMN